MWWNNRREIQDTDSETFKAKSFTVAEIVNRGYDLDLCGYSSTDEEILSPTETIRDFQERRAALNSKIDSRLKKLSALLQKDDNFSDFEDCLQMQCALSLRADYIVTRNVKDFAASEIPAVTPEEFLNILEEQECLPTD